MKDARDDHDSGTSGTGAALLSVFMELRAKIEHVVAGRLNDASAAADVVQDLYLKLRRIDARLPSDGEARRYLLKMAVNASIDHQRVEGRRAELLASAVDLFDVPQPGPEDAVLAADQLRSVDAALAELPEKCRQVLFMSRVEGRTHTEIAAALGVSRSLVEKYVVKAVLHCRVRLQSGGPR